MTVNMIAAKLSNPCKQFSPVFFLNNWARVQSFTLSLPLQTNGSFSALKTGLVLNQPPQRHNFRDRQGMTLSFTVTRKRRPSLRRTFSVEQSSRGCRPPCLLVCATHAHRQWLG